MEDISSTAWAKALALEWDKRRSPKDVPSPGQAKDNPIVIKLLPASLTTWKLFSIMAAKLDLSQGQGDGKQQLGRDRKPKKGFISFPPQTCGTEAKRVNVRNEALQIFVCLLTVERFDSWLQVVFLIAWLWERRL